MPDRSSRSFPLASHSRARRRIIATQHAEAAQNLAPETLPVEPVDESELVAPDNSTPIASELPHLAVGSDRDVAAELSAEQEAAIDLAWTGFEIRPHDTSDGIPAHQQELERAINFGPFKELLNGPKPITWVFTGDSITQGSRYTAGARSYVEHFAERTRTEMHRRHDVVINTSAPGETSRSMLEDFEWRVLRFRPDVVSVMIGINDAVGRRVRRSEFRDNLKHVIESARSEGALVLLHTPPHLDLEIAHAHTDLRTYVRLIRDVARDLDVACVDHWAGWKKAAEKGEIRHWLAADGVHPTADGQRALARLLFKRLGLLDDHSPLCAFLAQ